MPRPLILLLLSSPEFFIIILLAIGYGITVHEFSHVLAAKLQGDDTGERLGRLTLNPLAHVDPIGLLFLLFIGFGWGKPAPFNPYNLKYQKWGESLIAIAGPLSNFVSIVVFRIAIEFFGPSLGPENLLVQFFGFLILINIVLLVFNLIPIPPLDGSKILFAVLPEKFSHIKAQLASRGPWILFGLIIASNFLGINVFGRLFGFFFRLAGIGF
jgi:Zn-dependent protease